MGCQLGCRSSARAFAMISCCARAAPGSGPTRSLCRSSAPRPPAPDPAATGNAPDRLDAAVANAGNLLVQMHGGIGIPHHELDLVADPRGLARDIRVAQNLC